jgi:hypothetical protein
MHTYQLLSEILQALNIRQENQADADLLRLIGLLASEPKAARLAEEFAREGLPVLAWIKPPAELESVANRLGLDWLKFEACLQRLGAVHRLLKRHAI